MIESHEAPTQVSQTWPGSPGLLPAHRLTLCPDFLAGVSVTSELLDLVSLRYSDSTGRVSFPSLVCFLIRLEAMASKCHLGATLEAFTVTREHRRGPGVGSGPRPGQGLCNGWAGVLPRSPCPKGQSHCDGVVGGCPPSSPLQPSLPRTSPPTPVPDHSPPYSAPFSG